MIALRDYLWLLLWLAAPPLLAGLLVGLFAALLQNLTQLQDHTIAALPKLAALFVAVLWWGPALFQRLTQFAITVWGGGW